LPRISAYDPVPEAAHDEHTGFEKFHLNRIEPLNTRFSERDWSIDLSKYLW
jgi:hypothetical protein